MARPVTRLLPQELFGEIRVGNHLERAEVRRGGFDHRAATGLFRCVRIVDQQSAVPVARGGLEQPVRELVGLADGGLEMEVATTGQGSRRSPWFVGPELVGCRQFTAIAL
jgi:hypothetical protein